MYPILYMCMLGLVHVSGFVHVGSNLVHVSNHVHVFGTCVCVCVCVCVCACACVCVFVLKLSHYIIYVICNILAISN